MNRESNSIEIRQYGKLLSYRKFLIRYHGIVRKLGVVVMNLNITIGHCDEQTIIGMIVHRPSLL